MLRNSADEVFVWPSSGVKVQLLAQLTAQCNPTSVPCRKPCQERALHDAHVCLRFELLPRSMAEIKFCLLLVMKWWYPRAFRAPSLEGPRAFKYEMFSQENGVKTKVTSIRSLSSILAPRWLQPDFRNSHSFFSKSRRNGFCREEITRPGNREEAALV
jgi:hypothetical protein